MKQLVHLMKKDSDSNTTIFLSFCFELKKVKSIFSRYNSLSRGIRVTTIETWSLFLRINIFKISKQISNIFTLYYYDRNLILINNSICHPQRGNLLDLSKHIDELFGVAFLQMRLWVSPSCPCKKTNRLKLRLWVSILWE